jgi:Uma2 family endonuclease
VAISASEKNFELIKGILVDVSPTTPVHTVLAAWIAHLLLAYVDANDLGEVTGENGGYQLAADTVLAPDVGFVSKERLTSQMGDGFIPFAPDLAVEIISPVDTANAFNDRVLQYLESGTRLIWAIYPSSKTVTVYKSSRKLVIFDINNVLDGGDVLPGFSLPVREIFKKLRE